MYQINQTTNRINKLEQKSFSELGFRERDHLQEWVAYCPNALGEELLIIQKEFNGFDDTNERLDLLALDENGDLVIIENKLDDSGRDVVWQALKYASYCSTFTKLQIAEIFQQYLDKYEPANTQDAQSLICEFLNKEDFADVTLNTGNEQRIILIAANFRKEVTSTALWLLGHNIRLQCFRATPFALNEELLLNLEQIIPTPEVEDYMIRASEKEKEAISNTKSLASRHTLRQEFWAKTLAALKSSSCRLYDNVSPSKEHWLSCGFGITSIRYSLIFATNQARVEIVIALSNTEDNKKIFDYLYAKKEELEQRQQLELRWLRLDDYKQSRIEIAHSFEGIDKSNWEERITWLVEQVSKMEKTFKPEVDSIWKLLKA